mgnify:CR=1 FL=1
MLKGFSSLHGHSHFSLFDGLSTPEENVKAAKAKGLTSIALTDHGVNHGHADLYLSGKKHGVKVVFGVEAYVLNSLVEWNALKEKLSLDKKDKDFDKSVAATGSKELRRKGHLVLLACNRKGLSNINTLVYRAHKEGFYGKPRMDKQMLREHSEGIVASSACMGGIISKVCWDVKEGKATWEDAVREVRDFNSIFGQGRFYLELQLNEHPGQKFINECMVRLSQETGVPLTVTTDFHYSRAEEWEAREVLHMLDWDKTVNDFPERKIDAEIKQLYVKSPEEMWQTYLQYGKDHILEPVVLQAFENTLLIDSLIENFEPDVHKRLPTLKYEDPVIEMMQRAVQGLKQLGLHQDERYKKQLLYECKVIAEKGFANYFLVMQSIISKAKETMLVGEGRGSSAGSLVCYCLGITDYDPVANDLMFERFMDPSRTEEPDIDTDFEDVDETKDVLRKMFGEDNVACLSTYGTFQIKGLLKDLGRVYDLDHNAVNQLNKQIEKDLKVLYINQDKSTIVIKLEDIKRVSKAFNKFTDENPDLAKHIERLYNRNRHIGRHASGVIIGDNLMAETAIFCSGKEGEKVVQCSFTEGIVNKNLSAMGFVKFDILSIATLKVLSHAYKLVAEKEGTTFEVVRERMRSRNLDLNDPKVLKHVFWDGNFAGVFQFTEKGIRNLAQKVKPDTFTDVSAICSIYRPGPLGGGFDKLYVHNKHNPEDVRYDHPLLESILKPTRGCIVFQEQLMKICNVMGKMSWKDVNSVRKVLLKKDKSKTEEFLKSENDRLRAMFLKGSEENGFAPEKATDLWEKLLKFGGYGFNKAHSDTYSVMTFQCAYLATYHPMEFYAAVLTKGQSGDMQQYVGDIKRAGIEILPVDVNRSKLAHTKEGTGIRLSLRSVLGVGPAAIEKIVANQPYTDMIDFLDRSGATKTSIIPLIKVGAFESICKKPMAELEFKYETYANDAKLKTKKGRPEFLKIWDSMWIADAMIQKEKGQPDVRISLTGVGGDYHDYVKVGFENELLGFCSRGSPFEILGRKEKIEALLENDQLMRYEEFLESEDATLGRFAVLLKGKKEKPQRNGQLMAWLQFETMEGQEFEAPAFGGIWRYIRGKMMTGVVYIGTFNRKPDDPTGLLVGKPGFAHSAYSASESMISLDS